MENFVIAPQLARINIALAMAAKLISMLVAVLSVPLLLQLLDTHNDGTWLTLTPLIACISLLDLSVGHSMRNSVASMSLTGAEAVRLEFIGFFRMLCAVALLALAGFALMAPHLDLAERHQGSAWLLYGPPLVSLPLLLGSSVLQGARGTGLQAILQSASTWSVLQNARNTRLGMPTPLLNRWRPPPRTYQRSKWVLW